MKYKLLFLLISIAGSFCIQEEFTAQIPASKLSFEFFSRFPDVGVEQSENTVVYGSESDISAICSFVKSANCTALRRVRRKRNILSGYHHYSQLKSFINGLSPTFSHLARNFTLGQSVMGRELLGVEITGSPTGNPKFKPAVRLIGNIHGDETVGREILIRLIKDLLRNYGKDPKITELLDSVRVFIVPSMNPDGFELHRRTNANAVDLNRNFPDQFTGVPMRPQPESLAIRQWAAMEDFGISAVLHGGDLVANYPFDGNRQHRNGMYSKCPDDEFFIYLAKTYANAHGRMAKGNRRFPAGITNGADWYTLYGGSQDFTYLFTNGFEITLELSYPKTPPASRLNDYWHENRAALYAFIKAATVGVVGKASPNALVSVGNGKVIKADEKGVFYRPLKPGNYQVSVLGKTKNVEVRNKLERVNF